MTIQNDLLRKKQKALDTPLGEQYYCAYCGKEHLKKRSNQIFCPNVISYGKTINKCKHAFNTLIRKRDSKFAKKYDYC